VSFLSAALSLHVGLATAELMARLEFPNGQREIFAEEQGPLLSQRGNPIVTLAVLQATRTARESSPPGLKDSELIIGAARCLAAGLPLNLFDFYA
jgi:hypothetical protein